MELTSDDLTRAAGLHRMRAFAPAMGRDYAVTRNTDFGPQRRDNVSTLSPWITRRLMTEPELIACAQAAHGPRGAEKFIQEVFWRGYFKGWLEQRPQVWTSYRAGLSRDSAELDRDHALRARVDTALAGETGIACFDAWVRELQETGYLHNHARMWFASIWIFTLRLPWRLGADFFLSELWDGDAASNTLSWRWVGGLHTVGKAYVARASNIARHTDGRFPGACGLAQDPAPLDEGGLPERQGLRLVAGASVGPSGEPALWLITPEDGCPEDLGAANAQARLGICGVGQRSHRPPNERLSAAERVAVTDAVARSGGGAVLEAPEVSQVLAAAREAGAREVVTAYLQTGWVHDWAEGLRAALARDGIRFVEVQRGWDARLWPHATAGFFRVKKAIPKLLEAEFEDQAELPLFSGRA